MAPAVLESKPDQSASSSSTGSAYRTFMVLKIAPPLITEDQIAQYLDAIEAVMETVHSSASFWSDALNLAQRAARV
jgi:hypothetical protein